MTGWSAALGGIVLVVAVVALPALAIADNCGSITDCWRTAAAAAAAAAGAGALAATAAGSGKDDDCEAERSWVERCQAWRETLRQQLDGWAAQVQSLRMEAYALNPASAGPGRRRHAGNARDVDVPDRPAHAALVDARCGSGRRHHGRQ